MTTLTLTADETKRFWMFNEKDFRAEVLVRAEQKRKNLNDECVQVVGDDGVVLWKVTGERV